MVVSKLGNLPKNSSFHSAALPEYIRYDLVRHLSKFTLKLRSGPSHLPWRLGKLPKLTKPSKQWYLKRQKYLLEDDLTPLASILLAHRPPLKARARTWIASVGDAAAAPWLGGVGGLGLR